MLEDGEREGGIDTLPKDGPIAGRSNGRRR